MDTGLPPTTVLVIADGDAGEHASRALDEADGIVVVGSATPPGIDDAVADGAPDIAVIVVSGDGGGLASARALASRAAGTGFLAVVPVGADISPAALVEASIGAVVNAAPDAALADAVIGLARGEGFLDASLARHVLDRHRAGGDATALSPTEEEVLGRLAEGDSAEQIADDYAVSPRLVRLHAGGALARLFPAA